MAWKKITIKEKRKKVWEYHDNFLPEETPMKTKTGLINIPKNKETLKYIHIYIYIYIYI